MPSIVAVVVTFNSTAYIHRLLSALLAQTQPFSHIIVVDNHSQDDTCSIVASFQQLHSVIHLHRLSQNTGGAGGFAYGFQQAALLNPDAIITLDDDAYPENEQFLANLWNFKQQYQLDVVCPLVVDCQNIQKTCYEYHYQQKKLTDVQEIQQLTDKIDEMKLFNGTLFDKKVIEQLKGPRPEFFIRGDEEEFRSRTVEAGYKGATATLTQIFHPTSLHEYVYIRGKRYHHADSHFKIFFSTRNRFYMIRLNKKQTFFKKLRIVLAQFLRYTIFYLLYRKGDFTNYFVWFKAFTYGVFKPMRSDLPPPM